MYSAMKKPLAKSSIANAQNVAPTIGCPKPARAPMRTSSSSDGRVASTACGVSCVRMRASRIAETTYDNASITIVTGAVSH